MAKFISHPVEIDAWEFWPGTRASLPGGADVQRVEGNDEWVLWVEKSREHCAISPGDYVIEEPDGTGFYPCQRDIFLNRYFSREA